MIKSKTNEEILAENLLHYRKQAGYTQASLGEKLNYTDKAISKWERAECAPDIFTLKKISDLYGVPLSDFFISEKKTYIKKENKFHFLMVFFATLINVVSTIVAFCIVLTVFPNLSYHWMIFLYGLINNMIIFIIFACIWGRYIHITVSSSLLLWSVAVTVYLSLYFFAPDQPYVYLIFLAALPIQIGLLIYYFANVPIQIFKRKKKN